MGDVMDRFKEPETPQPVTGDEPDDAGEVAVLDRETGDVNFEPQGRHRPPQPHSAIWAARGCTGQETLLRDCCGHREAPRWRRIHRGAHSDTPRAARPGGH